MYVLCTLLLSVFLVASVSAAQLTSTYRVEVEGITLAMNGSAVLANSGAISQPAVIAGEKIAVKVIFVADEDDTDVTLEMTLKGKKVKTEAISSVFDVEKGKSYTKTLLIEVPYELKDEVSDEVTLSIEIDGKKHKTVFPDYSLRVQRPSYNAAVKSVTVPSSISAGQTIPVEIVLKNTGYNKLDDVYVTVEVLGTSISQGPKWFSDLVPVEVCSKDCEKEDTVYGKLDLNIPYNLPQGTYTLQVTVVSEDNEFVETKRISINNDYQETVLGLITGNVVSVGKEAVYEFLIVNPTDNVMVYNIVTESSTIVTSAPSESIVVVPAGSSKTVKVYASANKEGTYKFDVTILNKNEVVNKLSFDLEAERKTNAMVLLTIALALILLVLVVIAIVLLGKRPSKTEDFGESYY